MPDDASSIGERPRIARRFRSESDVFLVFMGKCDLDHRNEGELSLFSFVLYFYQKGGKESETLQEGTIRIEISDLFT